MNLIKKLNLLLSIACVGMLIGCASGIEKEERKQSAFDISGSYQANSASGSETSFIFEVANESGRHDILINLERIDSISDKEKNFLEFNGVNAADVFDYFKKVELGRGNNRAFDGGENISKDFGETSEFYVCSKEYAYNAATKVKYCLSGLFTKNVKTIAGALTLRVNGDSVNLNYATNWNKPFYRQSFGQWGGELFPLTNVVDLTVFKRLIIEEEILTSTFLIKPVVASNISYLGATYRFDAASSRIAANTFKKQDYPAIQIVYQGPSDKRIVLFGQVWSLGDLTGTIAFLDDSDQVDLATFRHRKK